MTQNIDDEICAEFVALAAQLEASSPDRHRAFLDQCWASVTATDRARRLQLESAAIVAASRALRAASRAARECAADQRVPTSVRVAVAEAAQSAADADASPAGARGRSFGAGLHACIVGSYDACALSARRALIEGRAAIGAADDLGLDDDTVTLSNSF